MPALYYVPGFGASQLNSSTPFARKVWVSYTYLAFGQFSALALTADGVTGRPPQSLVISPAAVMPFYGGLVVAALGADPQLAGTSIIAWPWDFRFALLSQSPALAQSIAEVATPEDPCSIVAHSAGGILARAAWSILAATGKAALVRRIVTIGTPHQGSYSAVQLLSADDQRVAQVAALGNLYYALGAIAQSLAPAPALSVADVIGVISSWPGLYDLMPVVGSADSSADPFRSFLFDATNWRRYPVSQKWLTQSLEVTGPWLLAPENMPPPAVLTTVAGTGYPTAGQLTEPAVLGYPSAYSVSADGDGTVSAESALVPASVQWTLVGRHNDIPMALAASGALAAMVLDVRPAGASPIAAMPVGVTASPFVAGPPSPYLGFPA